MAFLTRISPNLRSRRVRKSLANPYELHRDLMSAFPDAGPDTPGRRHYNVLHRLDALSDSMTLSPRSALIILSSIEPQWAHLPHDENGQPWTSRPHAIKSFDPDPDWFRPGQLFRFRLRANPTKRLHERSVDPAGKQIEAKWVGKRVEIRESDAQIEWLARRAKHHGFRLVDVSAVPERKSHVFDVVVRPGGKVIAHKAQSVITHAAVTFDGMLSVTDSTALCTAMLSGIGPAKAFGFGLLSIAPIR